MGKQKGQAGPEPERALKLQHQWVCQVPAGSRGHDFGGAVEGLYLRCLRLSREGDHTHLELETDIWDPFMYKWSL